MATEVYGASDDLIELQGDISEEFSGGEKRLKTATNACKKLADDEAAPAFVKSAAKYFMTSTTHPPLP